MTKRDWIAVGIKFLGVYFAVLGVVGLVILISMIAADIVSNFLEPGPEHTIARNSAMGLASLVQPLAYLGCAIMLTRRTNWCLRMAGFSESDA